MVSGFGVEDGGWWVVSSLWGLKIVVVGR
jgi:hypothetical protein